MELRRVAMTENEACKRIKYRMHTAGQVSGWKNAVKLWRSRQQRNRITRETDSRTDNLYTIHGFALPAVSIMRLIMIDMIIARIAGSALIGGMKYE